MLIEVLLIALILIALLIALPFIFKSIFKTKNYMGFTNGLCASALTIAAIIGVAIIGWFFWVKLLGRSIRLISDVVKLDSIIFNFVFILVIYIIIFLFIFFYTKGISNPNQPYNSVFMFIAGFLLPLFTLVYLYFILVSLLAGEKDFKYGTENVDSGLVILNEFFCLLNMIQIAGTIMLSMLHHRKVNKKILCTLLVCYFLLVFSFLIGLFFGERNLLVIPNMVLDLAPFGFGVFFYCKYASQDYPKSGLLVPGDI